MRHRQQIRAAHRERVDAEFVRHLVEQRFERVPGIDRPVTAHRAVGRRVAVDAQAMILAGGYAIERVQQRAGIEDRHQTVAGVGAAALDDCAVDGGDFAVLGQPDLHPYVGLGPAAVREKGLLAREFELHHPTRRAREQRGDHLEVQRFGPMAKAAADERLDHADP